MQKTPPEINNFFQELPVPKIDPSYTALMIVDMQYGDAHRDYGLGADAKKRGLEKEYEYYFSEIDKITPRIRRILEACRDKGVTAIYLRVVSKTLDGRDVSPFHKKICFVIKAGTKEAEILHELEPHPSELVIEKTSESPFNSTGIDQTLRNMGIKHVIVCGVLTNQCVECTVRDAADRGYDVTLVDDACAALTANLRQNTLENLRNYYAVLKDAETVVKEISSTG